MKIIEEKMLYHLPPKRRTIRDINSNFYFLSFPHMAFVIRRTTYYHLHEYGENVHSVTEMNVAFTTSEPNSNSILYLPALPNTDMNGNVCLGFGSYFVEQIKDFRTMSRSLVDFYFSSAFRFGDMDYSVNEYIRHNKEPLCCFDKWQEKTKSNPLWIPGNTDMVPFKSHNVTIFLPLNKYENNF